MFESLFAARAVRHIALLAAVTVLSSTAVRSAHAQTAADPIGQQANALEGELGKYKDTAPEAAEALVKLTELYHSNGRVFGLVRAAQRFVSAHPTDQRHEGVMLKLLDGLEALSRHKEFTVIARQFLTRYPQSAACGQVEERLAFTLEKLGEKDDAAEVFRARWRREPNPNGRRFGIQACLLFSQTGNEGITQGAELGEEMFDKLPRDDFARHVGVRAYYEWRRISQWAKANVIGNKLVQSGLLTDAEERREVLRTMAEHYGYLGQHSNAAATLAQVRQIRDDQWALHTHIQRLYDSVAPAAEMEPLVKQYLNTYPDRDDRYERIGLLAHAWNREKNTDRALALFRQLLPIIPATHNIAGQFYQMNGQEPDKLKDTEAALLQAIPQCEQKMPDQVWSLRYTLAFSVYRDQMKDNAKAKAMMREMIEKSPTNDGHIWNSISWLLSNAESDAEFQADASRIIKCRRDWIHWTNLRQYPQNWTKANRKDKDIGNRAEWLDAELEKADKDPVVALVMDIRRGPYDARDADVRDQLLKPENFNTLNLEMKRYVLWDHGYYHQHYAPADERAEAAMYYSRLVQLFPENFEYRYRYLQVATDYGQPEVAKEAALSVLSTRPTANNNDVWRRLMIAAEKNEDQDLARRSLAWRRDSIAAFGVDSGNASGMGDVLMRMKLETEAVALWNEFTAPGLNHYEARECAWRVFQKIEDPQERINFAQARFTPDTDYHGRYAYWVADQQLRLGNVAAFETTLRDTLARAERRPFRSWDMDAWALHYMLNYFRTSNADYRVDKEKENTPEDVLRVARVIRDMQFDWPSAQAELVLLEAEPQDARSPMDRLLAWNRVTRPLPPDSHRWDQLMPFAQSAVTRQDYSAAATLLTGMLENFTTATDSRKDAGRAMIGQCYTRLGTVGLTIDENSPIAPLLQAALYLRLGDERLALDTFLANQQLFDQHRDEVPVDLVVFACENMMAAGGDENHNKVEDVLRQWIIKNADVPTVDAELKAQIQFLLARNFYSAKRFDVARNEYQTVLNRYPETTFAIEAEFGIGETFMAQKVYDQAEQVFEKLAASRDAEVIVRAEFLRGVLAHRRGDNDEARDIFRTVLERVPDIELANQALFNLSEVYGAEERYMDQLQLLMTVGRLGRVSKRQHAPGTSLSIVVQDSDLGISRGHNRIPVIVRTVPGGDEELVYLTSGGAGKGLFRADVDTQLGPVTRGDKVLQVSGNDVIRSDYPEEFKAEFKSVPLSDVEIRIASDASFEVASSKIVDIEEETFSERLEREARERENDDQRQSQQRPTNQIKPGNPIYIRVKDGDRDLSDSPDQIVTKLVADSGDQVQVTLTETGPHSGVFEGAAVTGELPAGALATDTAIDHSPLMAIDNSRDTFWLSEPDGATPKILTIDMKDLQTVSRARFMTPRVDDQRPVRGELQASYDGEFWYTVAAHPALPDAPAVAAEYGAMQFKLFSANATNYTTWQQVMNLASGEPIAQGAVTDGLLQWQRPNEEDENLKYVAAVWYGRFVQPKAGAVRFAVNGFRTAVAINGVLQMDVGAGNRTVDVWLERGLHDLTIFSAAHPSTPTISATRARADLNRQQVILSPFLSSDFDLANAVDLQPVGQTETNSAESNVKLSVETATLNKKTEQFAVVDRQEVKELVYWQDLEDSAAWQLQAPPGVYDVWLNYSHQGGGSRFRVSAGEQNFEAVAGNTGNWQTYKEERFGTIILDGSEPVALGIHPLDIRNGGLMGLRSIELRPTTESRVVLSDSGWEFRFAPVDVRYTRFVINEYLGEAVAVNHVEISGSDINKPYIPTEADVLALSENDSLEIAGGDVVTATYTDEVTQVNAGGSRLLSGILQATYFNGGVTPIAYDFERQTNGAVATVRKQLKRVDPGDRIVVEIVDYDRDQSVTRDKLQFEVSINGGDPIPLSATETEENSGIFTKEVDTAATAEGDRLVVKAGDQIHIRYLDEQNTFPGHSVPRESTVYVNRPTEARIRIFESRVIPSPQDSTAPPRFVFQAPSADSTTGANDQTDPPVTRVAFEAPLTVEVIDPDAAKDSRSEVVVKMTTSDGAVVDVRCVISAAFTAVPFQEGETYALEEGRFIGQVVMQLGSKNSSVVVPITAEMPRNLIGGGVVGEEESEGLSQLDQGLVAAVLNLTGKDRIAAVYNDERRPAKSPEKTQSYARLIANGELISLDRDYDKPIERLHVGEKLFLMVTDADQDSSDERDMVKIQITTEFGEKEDAVLIETLAHSGVFTGSLTLKSNEKPQPGNLVADEPVVECYFGDTLTITYLDPIASSDSGQLERVVQLPVVIGTDGLVSAFSKTFNNEQLAVETKFHIAESYFELFKSHRTLGRNEEEQQDLAAGRRVLREVIEDFPDPQYQPRILYLLGQFAQELGDVDEAVSAYEQIVSQFPDHPIAADSQYKLAQTYEESGDFDEALEAYVTLAATYPRSPLIANVMIRISDHFYKNEEYPIAAEVGRKFLEKFEGHQYASRMAFRIGQCFYKAEDYRQAGDAFDWFAKEFPDDELAADSLFWSGESFRMGADNREAFRRYNRCRWDFPSSDAAKYARGRLALPEMLQQFEAEANAVENETN